MSNLKKQYTFLFCSMGNVMQRHFRNLKKLLPGCKINVYLPNAYDEYRIFDDKLNISFVNTLLKAYSIDNIFYGSELDKAFDAERYDAVFIGTLPPNRLDIAIKCAMKEIHLFIEKPLSNNLDGVYKLRDIIEEKNLKCAVGFQMRFSPIIEELKQMVDDNIFGDIYRIEITHANNIHNWTKGRDLTNFYALRESNGGGVFNSQCHEIDYLSYLFGKHYPISAIYGNWLNISEVEDNITILSSLEKNYCIPIIINLDFISTIPRRDITIHGLQKTQTFDLMPINPDKWNDLFVKEISAFINYLGGDKPYQLATLEDGIASLEYCMDIKTNFMKVNI